MKGQVFFATILFVVVGNIQADAVVPAYVVTEQGVTCSDDDMSDIDHSSECQIAITEIQDEIPGASFSGEVDYANNPPGCWMSYTSSVFWNANSQGVAGNVCSSCRSICKSSEYIYKEDTYCPRQERTVKYSTLSLATQACSANVSCTALTDYRCNGGFWTCEASNLTSKATNTKGSCSWQKRTIIVELTSSLPTSGPIISGIISGLVANIRYNVQIELLQTDTNNINEYASSITLGSTSFGTCHPEGDQCGTCNYATCSSLTQSTVTATSTTLQVEITFTNYVDGCSCNLNGNQARAAARITLTYMDNPCDPDPCNADGATDEVCDAGICNCGDAPCDDGIICNAGVCDFCNGETCSSHGTCSVDAGDTTDGYLCTCSIGYTGNNCENDPCTEKTCSSNGYCSVDVGDTTDGYLCTCLQSYVGNDCENFRSSCTTDDDCWDQEDCNDHDNDPGTTSVCGKINLYCH